MTFPARRPWLLSPDHLVWALPLLAGAAAWLHAHQATLPENVISSAATARERETAARPAPYHGDAAELFEATLRDYPRPEQDPPREPSAESPLTGEARREQLLQDFQDAEKNGYPSSISDRTLRMEKLACELGRDEGAEGLAWCDAHLPALRRLAMDGWADADPAAAFAALTRGDRTNAALHSTVMKLLAGQAATGGPDALRAAVARVPWSLFPLADGYASPLEESGVYPLAGDASLWVDSGVARSLAQQGIQISGLYEKWAAQDPAAALEAWATWPVAPDWRDVLHFRELAAGAQQSGDTGAALAEAIAQASPQLRERLAAVKNHLQQHQNLGPEFSARIRDFLPADPP